VTLHLSPADYVVLGLYFCIPLTVGYLLRKKGSKDSGSFLLSGRSLPWWLAGTSMAADTFASDTPLYVSRIVRQSGVAANWEWWCFAFSGLLSVFLLAPLWRRTEATTDLEFCEMRYGGPAAAFLRGFKAFLLAVPYNGLVLGGMPLLAMTKILLVTAGVDDPAAAPAAKALAIGVSLGVVLAYAAVSGLWAVVVNDFLMIGLALVGAVTLAFYAVGEVGGLAALREKVLALDGGDSWRTDLLPSPVGGTKAIFGAFLVWVGVQWWAHRTADGGGVFAQRMLACRSEGHAVGATLWFNVLNYAVRTWPWILCGLAAVVLYPDLKDPEAGYPMLMRDLLPAGLRGLVLASLFAAFMSTADTQLHWGAGYLVNDLYRRFLVPKAPDGHYVTASRAAMAFLVVVTGLVAFYSDSVTGVFQFLLTFFAGTGTVFLARWLWWRVNAWGELAAMVAAPAASLFFRHFVGDRAPAGSGVMFVAMATVAAWLSTALLTPPVEMDRLVAFYRKTRPPGFWGPVRAACADAPAAAGLGRALGLWVAGLALVLGLMAGTGKLLLGEPGTGVLLLAAAAAGGTWIRRAFRA
jgi:SSS family solute:Na+ symporter